MEALIRAMMLQASVTEEQLRVAQEIQTGFGEILSWKYLSYAKRNIIGKWGHPTAILYAEGDALTERPTVDAFARRFGCKLTVMKNGEHWFHTEEQLAVWKQWVVNSI